MIYEDSGNLETANRIHCITVNGRTTYRLRIEDYRGNALTEFVELSRDQTKDALQLSVLPGTTPKENLMILDGGEEDYRLPIVNESILRARLYP